MEINGMKLQENSALTDTILIRMCRSKRKRIVKKWLKNKHNYKTVPSQQILVFADPRLGCKVIVCHPIMAARIREVLKQRDIEKYDEKIVLDLPNVPILQDKYKISEQLRNFT